MTKTNADGGEPNTLKMRIARAAFMFLSALVFVLFVAVFVFQVIRVDGVSMRDTLVDGERMLVTKYQYLFADPERFDVVVCHYPGAGYTNYVKRVVGVPGDRVAMLEGVLYVNGEPVEERYVMRPPNYWMDEITVQEGHYFVLGDNRPQSRDSHVQEVGQLARAQIVGRVRAVIWPLGSIRAIR